MSRRSQFVPWRSAGRVSEREASGDDVVRRTGWVFNNETGSALTLEQFVATGDAEAGSYLTILGLRPEAPDAATFIEIGCGIGRMTCAFTREFGHVVACDLDAGFLERCFETVGRFGRTERLRTLHVADGRTLDLAPNSADVAFSYITLQHCNEDDALELSSEAVRVTKPGGTIALNFRSRRRLDALILPAGAMARTLFRIPAVGPRLARVRWLTRLGWQANRLHPDAVIGPLSPLLADVRVWRNPRSRISGYRTTIEEFAGINRHHYWIVATVR
ncbi:MAG: class I SAM-dependent methyltransferase [Actinomycetota bacterium]